MSIGNNIKKLRELKNYTQAHMANQLDLSIGGYGKMENDEVQIKVDRLEKIAEILNVDTRDLISDNGKQHFENVTHSQIGSGRVVNNIDNKVSELYDKIISRQQDEINYLKGIVDIFKK